jgi:autotransporter passenger strand-loop-strand repeat protein
LPENKLRLRLRQRRHPGSQLVESGGTASGAIISGGTETVAGTDVDAQVSGGTEMVLSGGIATGDTVFTGSQVVSSGGVTSGTIVSGGTEDVYGIVSGTVLDSGGVQVIEAGGSAIGTVFNGGTQDVLSGASISGTWHRLYRRTHSGVLGVGLLPPFRGQGHGAALIQSTLSEARRVGLVRFELTVHADNERAIALYKRVGFKKEGTMKDAALIDGHYKDLILMAIVECMNAAPEKPAVQP